MKILKIIVVGFVLTSCCNGLAGSDECMRDDFLYFKILSMTGDELFTGATPKYTVDQLKLYRVDNGTRVDVGAFDAGTGQLGASIDFKYKELIVEVQGQPKDTIDISFEIINDKCCEDQSRIKTTTVDGQEREYNYPDGIEIRIVD